MLYLFFLPFLLQTALIFCDEFYFHIRRGLPRWERMGHPLDTLTVLICLAFTLIFPYNPMTRMVYIGLALFSAIFVTKDEFVHKEWCPAGEQWLHALLFLNHPVVLFALAYLWQFKLEPLVGRFLWGQTLAVACFGLYQWIYWNFVRRNENQ